MDTASSNIAGTEKFCDFLQIYLTAKFGLIVQYNTNIWYNSINQGKEVSLFFNLLGESSVPNKRTDELDGTNSVMIPKSPHLAPGLAYQMVGHYKIKNRVDKTGKMPYQTTTRATSTPTISILDRHKVKQTPTDQTEFQEHNDANICTEKN
ncbi:hypothetical protein I7I51_06615 [Histoplasma capsulatum]|uniref:Uncharacterized protein n=1 Tax=Ajellomyces capsulatus TaxID=5037 RepID=A0A8A1MH18_AJECA|nr:hypothetical protein I7I51_06615 [Histoplasma capsulatum]